MIPEGQSPDYRLDKEQPYKMHDLAPGEWTYQTDLPEPPIEIDSGKRASNTYSVGLPAEGQYRRLITQLVT